MNDRLRPGRKHRPLAFEQCEHRSLMAADSFVLDGQALTLDVDRNQHAAAVDAYLASDRSHGPNEIGSSSVVDADHPLGSFGNVDGRMSATETRKIINSLNQANIYQSNGSSSLKAEGEAADELLEPADISALLQRAAMATTSEDAIIAVVDRSGRILGVRTEAGVVAAFAGRDAELAFAIDGAVAKARTAAFFSSNQAPLTSRTVRFISQSTVTQREVEANPNIADLASPLRGPGLVAPIGVGAHFPPEIPFTPEVDLFAIEQQSRDSATIPGPDGIGGTADDLTIDYRFNVNPNSVPDVAKPFMQTFPESYGTQSGEFPTHQARGIGTLPGGVPLYKNGHLVGGIGVFFPGPDGFASYEQDFVHADLRPSGEPQSNDDRLNAPLVLESEFIAFFTASGSIPALNNDAPVLPQFKLPKGRIDLVGITLESAGPHPTRFNPVSGQERLKQVGKANGAGQGANNGVNQPVSPGGDLFLEGQAVPEGWLVTPQASAVDAIMASDVERIIQRGIKEAKKVRAAIRLPIGERTRMILAVTDSAGEVLGLYRMPDATVFSVDVAVAKARNTSYYAGPDLQPTDAVDHNNDGQADVPGGTAFTNRTFRYLALPRFPSGARDGSRPGDFSSLLNPGINRLTAENSDPLNPLPASVYSGDAASVQMYTSFNPSRNFRDPRDLTRQNGVVYFPGSTPLYRNSAGSSVLIGGFGVSGDGVDQDDVVTVAGQKGYAPPKEIRADRFFVANVRLPFQKFLRNPFG